MNFTVGDLLVKNHGTQRVFVVVKLSPDSLKMHDIVHLLDMKSGQETPYYEVHVRSWRFYKHYPVRG